MNAPVRTMVLRSQGLSDTGDTPMNEMPQQPWLFFVVEDSADDQLLARRVLEKSPYAGEIICVPDGQALFERMKSMACFDEGPASERCVVLLDINLVKGTGLSVLETLRTHPQTEATKIIMVTGDSSAVSAARNALICASSAQPCMRMKTAFPCLHPAWAFPAGRT